jgi:hypothetical protein
MEELTLKEENLINRIYLAILYETETKQLKRAVKRNIDRFPEDFMFELTKEEFYSLRCQIVTSNYKTQNIISSRGGTRYLPFAFTEQGVAMLSSILNSKKAITVNIAIMRTFVQLRRIASLHSEIFERIENLETGFESLKDLVRSLLIQEEKPKMRIGFYTDDHQSI